CVRRAYTDERGEETGRSHDGDIEEDRVPVRRGQHAPRQRRRAARSQRLSAARVRRRQPRPLLGDLRGAARRARIRRLSRRPATLSPGEPRRSAAAARVVLPDRLPIRGAALAVRATVPIPASTMRTWRERPPPVVLRQGRYAPAPRELDQHRAADVPLGRIGELAEAGSPENQAFWLAALTRSSRDV